MKATWKKTPSAPQPQTRDLHRPIFTRKWNLREYRLWNTQNLPTGVPTKWRPPHPPRGHPRPFLGEDLPSTTHFDPVHATVMRVHHVCDGTNARGEGISRRLTGFGGDEPSNSCLNNNSRDIRSRDIHKRSHKLGAAARVSQGSSEFLVETISFELLVAPPGIEDEGKSQ